MNERTKQEAKPKPGPSSEVVPVQASFGTVFIRRLGDGTILRPIKAIMTLREKDGHLYHMSGNDYDITASGYFYLNKTASINILTPQNVAFDGRSVPNPYILRNEETNMVRLVGIRKLGIGYSPAGNITAIDSTLYYNPYTYFIQSIEAKMKAVVWEINKQSKKWEPTNKPKFPKCAFIGTRDDKPEAGKYVFFETVFPLGIWANYEDEAFLACLNEHTQRQKFAERTAATIVSRNILKNHPAISVSKPAIEGTVKGEHTATVTIYGWRHEMTRDQIEEVRNQAEMGRGDLEIKSEDVVDVQPEEEKVAIEEVAKEDAELSPAVLKEPPDDFFLKQQQQNEARKEKDKK